MLKENTNKAFPVAREPDSAMLKLYSATERDGIEEQSALQETGGFKNEIRELESLIASLTEPQTSSRKPNGQKNKRVRSFGLQKLRLRRSTKKKSVNAEQTKEEFMERVKFLQGICNDLTARLKDDEFVNGKPTSEEPASYMEEARDDNDEIVDFRQRIEEDEREGKEKRDELIAAIEACEKVLSNFSDSTEDMQVTEDKEEWYDNEIEMTESKFLADTAYAEDCVVIEEIGENAVEIQLTESKAAENATSSMCCLSNFKIVEMIEIILCNVTGDKDQGDKEEDKTQETKQAEEEVAVVAVTSSAAADEKQREERKQRDETVVDVADDEDRSALGCCFFNMCCLQTTNTDIEPAASFPSPEEKARVEAPTNALFNALSAEEDTLYTNPTFVTTDTSLRGGGGSVFGCCTPVVVAVCALDDPALDTYNVADSDDIRQPRDTHAGKPALVTAKSMETEFTSLENTTVDGKTLGTLENMTVDRKTVGTIDHGFFTSLDSIVGAKTRGKAKKNEDFWDPLKAEDIVTSAVAGAVANVALNVYNCDVCAVESSDIDLLAAGDEIATEAQADAEPDLLSEPAVIKPVSTMDFIPKIEVVNTLKAKKKKITGAKKNQKTTPVSKKGALTKKAVKKMQKTGTEDVLKLSAMKSVETERARNINAVKSAETLDIRRMKSICTMDFVPRLEVARFKKKTTTKKVTGKAPKKQTKAPKTPKKQGATKRKVAKKAPNTKNVGKKAAATKKMSKKPVSSTKRPQSPKKKQKKVLRTNKMARKPGKKLTQSEYRRIMAKKRREQRKRGVAANGKQERAVKKPESPKAKPQSSKIERESPESLAKKSISEMPPPNVADLLNFFNPLPPHMREGYLPNPHGDDVSSVTGWTPGTGLKDLSLQLSEDEGPKNNFWFFQRAKKDEHPEIEESLSPVFSIPNVDTHGTRFDEHDEDYIDQYYNFSDAGNAYHAYN